MFTIMLMSSTVSSTRICDCYWTPECFCFFSKSGTSNPYWAVQTPELIESNVEKLAIQTGCLNDDTLLECLHDAPAEELLINDIIVAPVIDGTTLLDDPLTLIESGQLQRKDSIVGK